MNIGYSYSDFVSAKNMYVTAGKRRREIELKYSEFEDSMKGRL